MYSLPAAKAFSAKNPEVRFAFSPLCLATIKDPIKAGYHLLPLTGPLLKQDVGGHLKRISLRRYWWYSSGQSSLIVRWWVLAGQLLSLWKILHPPPMQCLKLREFQQAPQICLFYQAILLETNKVRTGTERIPSCCLGSLQGICPKSLLFCSSWALRKHSQWLCTGRLSWKWWSGHAKSVPEGMLLRDWPFDVLSFHFSRLVLRLEVATLQRVDVNVLKP